MSLSQNQLPVKREAAWTEQASTQGSVIPVTFGNH